MTLIKHVRVTKKYLKGLKHTTSFLSLIRLKRLFAFLLRNRQLLQRFFLKRKLGPIQKENLYSLQKKNKLRLSNYLLKLDLSVIGILFYGHLVTQIKMLKQFILHNFLFINNKIKIKGYMQAIKPLDIIS
jgi:hypothetical protein